ncbi:RNA-directed DNA polymerase, partial [Tanacetum coccineum]
CHSSPSGGHHGISTTARNVFKARFYWPNILCDVRRLVPACDACQRADNISLRDETPQKYIQINELDKIRLDAYESSIFYKERTKRWRDKRIKTPTKYEKGDKVLLFNSILRLFPGKLKSRWNGPFSVNKDMKNGAIELYDEDGNEFIVNKQRVKPYQKNVLDTNRDDDITLDDEGEVT